MLDGEPKLHHLRKVLEFLGLLPSVLGVILGGSNEIGEDVVIQVAVSSTAEIASSLVDILSSPEGTIGYINVQGQSSGWTANGGLWLLEVSFNVIEREIWNTYVAEADRSVNTLNATITLSSVCEVVPRAKKERLIIVNCSEGLWRIA